MIFEIVIVQIIQVEQKFIVQVSQLHVTMYDITLQECNYVFKVYTHLHNGHALAGYSVLQRDKMQIKAASESRDLQECKRTLDVGGQKMLCRLHEDKRLC